jgi:hypothetical protein
MKNIKTTIITSIIALCCYTKSNAQENAKITFPPPRNWVSISAGAVAPSADAKDKAFIPNSTAIGADVFLSLKRWTPIVPKHVSLGVNIGAAYNFGGSGGFGTTPNALAVTGQTSSIVSDRGVDPKSPGFKLGAGPQVNFQFGKFMVSPMVLGEYLSTTQKEISSVQTTVVGGQSYDFKLATLPETKTSGFALTPKLRMQYMISSRFGFFADASYTMGPKIETQTTRLIPNGNPTAPETTYELQALQNATFVKGETKSTALNSTSFNFGVVFGFGRDKTDDNVKKGLNGAAGTAQSIDNIEQIVDCGPGLYPNFGGNCYPCFNCHPCPTNYVQVPPEYCDNSSGVIVFAGNAISAEDLINQIKESKFEISEKDKKRLLNNSEAYNKVKVENKKDGNVVPEIVQKSNVKSDLSNVLCGCCGELRGLEHKIFHESKCNKTTELFYQNDYVMDDQNILNHLNTKELIIKKGTYIPDYSKNPFGNITLNLVKPILINDVNQDFNALFSGIRCRTGCDDEGQDCFQCKASIPPAALDFVYTLSPIIKNGKAAQIVLSNKSISIKDGTNSNLNATYRVACPPGLYPNGNNCYPCLGCHPCGTSFCDNATNSIINTPISSFEPIELINKFESGTLTTKIISKKDLKRLIIENSENIENLAKKVKCSCGDMVYAKDAAACKRICDFLGDAPGY